MKASKASIDLIKQFESLRLDAYLCPAGIPTIGWGHTYGVKIPTRITEEMAEYLLSRDVHLVETVLGRLLEIPVTQGQWDALISLCFNLKGGAAALPRLAPRLWADLQAGRTAEAAQEFLDINRAANGQVLPGLTRRREAESALFLSREQGA